MTFLAPSLAIAGLVCVGAPILIHLLTRRRRRPIPWGAMRFLLEAFRKHRRRLRLEQLALLACRCLLVALIGLALGKPIFGAAANLAEQPVDLFLLIDNSLTSQAVGPRGEADLTASVKKAKELLKQLDPTRGDRAAVVMLTAPNSDEVALSSDLASVGKVLDGVIATESRADVPAALSRVAHMSGADDRSTPGERTEAQRSRRVIAILSAFRAGIGDVTPITPSGSELDGVSIAALRPAADDATNVSITGIQPLRPLLISESGAGGNPGGNQVQITMQRRGEALGAGTTSVRVFVRGAALTDTGAAPAGATAVVRWQPAQSAATLIVPLETPSDILRGGLSSVAIVAGTDADAIPGDNVFTLPASAMRSARIALVAPSSSFTADQSIDAFSAARWLRLALEPSSDRLAAEPASGMAIVEVDGAAVSRSGLAGYDAAVIPAPDTLDDAGWARIGQFVQAGGVLLVSPPASVSVHLWTDAFVKATGVDWSIAREARAYDTPVGIAPRPSGAANTGDLLSLLDAELDDLSKGIHVDRVLPITPGPGAAAPLLALTDGSALLVAGTPDSGAPRKNGAPLQTGRRGVVIMLAAAPQLSWTDLPAKPLMVPLVQELLRQAIGRSQETYASVAGAPLAAPPDAESLSPLDDPSGPTLRPDPQTPVRRRGLWRAMNSRGSTVGLVAVNADASAGDTRPLSEAEITAWLRPAAGPGSFSFLGEGLGGEDSSLVNGASAGGSSGARVSAADAGRISMLLLLGALGVGLLEIGLARWFSHADDAANAGATA